MAAPRTLDEAIAEAKKVVGDTATMPNPKADVDKMPDAMVLEVRKFQSALTNLYTELLLIEKALKSCRYGMERNAAIYEKADFGLDEKSRDDAKKIKQARKIFDDFFAQKQKSIDEKGFSELYDRVLQVMQTKWTPPA